MICIDASVFVSSARPSEASHHASSVFLHVVQAESLPLCAPLLVLPEAAAAITRNTGRAEQGYQLVQSIRSLIHLQLVPLEEQLAQRAAEIASHHRLRGADAVYVAVAEARQATLVTWGQEMLHRAAALVPARTPDAWHPA